RPGDGPGRRGRARRGDQRGVGRGGAPAGPGAPGRRAEPAGGGPDGPDPGGRRGPPAPRSPAPIARMRASPSPWRGEEAEGRKGSSHRQAGPASFPFGETRASAPKLSAMPPSGRADHALHITGGRPLHGRVRVGGSKNASLPIMAAAMLTREPVELGNVAGVADTALMCEILGDLGVTVAWPACDR